MFLNKTQIKLLICVTLCSSVGEWGGFIAVCGANLVDIRIQQKLLVSNSIRMLGKKDDRKERN